MSTGETMSLSALLVRDNSSLLERACSARFMTEVRNKTLDVATFRNYLAIERHFVVESARLMAAAALRAPDETALVGHLDAAHDLVHGQLDYFSHALARVGDPGPISEPALEQARGLAELARHVVASGDYWRLIVLSFTTEHLYLTWCQAALPHIDPETEVGRWVAMHTTTTFSDRVRQLAGEVDRVTPPDAADQAGNLYRAVLEAELTFHEAPYLKAAVAADEETETPT